MKKPIYVLDNEKEESLFLRENLYKYLKNWPWFLLSIFLCLLIGFMYIRYAPVIYSSNAKIKIIDDSKEFDIATDALSLLGAGSNINLDNEIAVIKSYRLLEQVVDSLHLDVQYYEVGQVKTRQVFKAPIIVKNENPKIDIEKSIQYSVQVDGNDILIKDEQGQISKLNSDSTNTEIIAPFKIERNYSYVSTDDVDKEYLVNIINKEEAVLLLMESITVEPLTEKSEVLSIKIQGESIELSEAILNVIIEKFNTDGILDRQLVSKRTLDFIDERFIYLSEELDSIESGKKEYKKSNNLSYLEADAGVTIEKRSVAESEVFRLETQIELAEFLKETLEKQTSFSLLPADIGVENANINTLVYEYNQVVLERDKVIISAGDNNPLIQQLSSQLERAKQNILNTLNTYQKQLNISLGQLKKKESSAQSMFSKLPEKERMIRAIERQQFIKENLFVLLLQKREEAAINFAVTAPSVKVVDYGLTDLEPVTPKKILILGIALFLGIFLPLAFFFTKYSFDTKIKTKSDLERLSGEIPVIAEIPTLKDPNDFFHMDARSVKAESFRILATNIIYLLPNTQQKDLGSTIYITSAIKGEGKTSIALNLAIAISSLKKKVLLVGADLRNPQLQKYFEIDKEIPGLSNILYDSTINWRDCIQQRVPDNNFLDIFFSGPIPPNASQLISNDNLNDFLSEAKKEYDYIIFDTAPTIQVADTLLISKYADVTIFVVRQGYTDKRLMEFSKDLENSKKLKNMVYVFNDVKFNKRAGYNYGYEYGYQNE